MEYGVGCVLVIGYLIFILGCFCVWLVDFEFYLVLWLYGKFCSWVGSVGCWVWRFGGCGVVVIYVFSGVVDGDFVGRGCLFVVGFGIFEGLFGVDMLGCRFKIDCYFEWGCWVVFWSIKLLGFGWYCNFD